MNYQHNHFYHKTLLDICTAALFTLCGLVLTQGVVMAWDTPAALFPTPSTFQSIQGTSAEATSSDISLNWSGYVAQGATYTSVTGSWVVPTVAQQMSGSVQADATWVGVGGVAQPDLIQAGTQAIIDIDGSIVYQPWLETIPGDSYVLPIGVRPGDSITTTITQQSAKTWLVLLRNNTTGKSYQTTIAHNSSLSSAEWVEEMPSSAYGNFFIPLDGFGRVPFTGGSTVANGVTQTIAASGAQPLTMKSLMGDVLATTSVLGADGGSFLVSRTDAEAQMALSRRHHRSNYYTFYFTRSLSPEN